MSKFDVTEARSLLHKYDSAGTGVRVQLCRSLEAACNYIEALRATFDKLERVREAAEKTKCVTPEVGPRGNFPCFVCPVCELHRALAACDDGEGA